MENMTEEKVKDTLQSFLGKDVFIRIEGVIDIELTYEDFSYFMNKNRFLMCDKTSHEINVEMGNVEIMKANEFKVVLKLDNEEEITLQL